MGNDLVVKQNEKIFDPERKNPPAPEGRGRVSRRLRGVFRKEDRVRRRVPRRDTIRLVVARKNVKNYFHRG
jgi:hypothetical protein